MNVLVRMAVDRPTDTDFTTAVVSTSGREGWLEIFLPHTGDAVGTLSFRGGLSSTQSTHDDLELDETEIYVEGANLSTTAVTGLTYTAPGTLTIAATLAADVRIRIPVINPTPFISLVYNQSSGGSSTQYIQATWFFREEDL
jgi:hypothetical protein